MTLKNKYAIAINKAKVESLLTVLNDGEIARQTEEKRTGCKIDGN